MVETTDVYTDRGLPDFRRRTVQCRAAYLPNGSRILQPDLTVRYSIPVDGRRCSSAEDHIQTRKHLNILTKFTKADESGQYLIRRQVNDLLKRYCGGRGDAVDAGVKSVLKTMLHIIQHLRHEKRPKWHTTPAEAAGDTSWKNNFWMDLNYLYVAQAARWCHAHFSAVMYAEIWLDRFNRDGQSEHTSAGAPLIRLEIRFISFSC